MLRTARPILMALGAAVCAAAALAQTQAGPGTSTTPVAAAPVSASAEATARCAALRARDFSALLDAPTRIVEARITRVADDLPEVCQLEGYVSPTVGFRIAMPVNDWNGKYVQGGCGGACGTTRLLWCDEPLRRGYACLSTDMGHKSTTADWVWGWNDLTRRADFGYRATHVSALAGKALAAAYYGRGPQRSYFLGCSTGGRQGLLSAQRFPRDFDGIIAGAAPLDETGTALQLAWSVRANLDANGQPILQAPDVERLHRAVIAACDRNDGIDDGLIGDPRQCRFDVASLQCSATRTSECLTPAQVTAAQRIYSGPVDSKGKPIGRQGGAMLGSERWWIGDYVPGPNRPPQYAAFIQDFFRYVAFDPAPGPAWSLADLDFERDAQRLGVNEILYSANNPDLRAFRDAGGKLLAFQGWGDTSVVPGGYLDYYETVERTMGGREATQQFFRMFTVPGMRHCSADGSGGDAINYLEAMERWVEQGQAPDVLIGANYDWRGPVTRSLPFPLDPSRVRFTRPAYLYPATPVYLGRGDPREASSFRPSHARRP